jgi:hypothetical protein
MPDFNREAITDRVRSELAGHRDRTFLIIDDLHELASPETFLQLTRLLENLPAHVHVILAARRVVTLLEAMPCHATAQAALLTDIRHILPAGWTAWTASSPAGITRIG